VITTHIGGQEGEPQEAATTSVVFADVDQEAITPTTVPDREEQTTASTPGDVGFEWSASESAQQEPPTDVATAIYEAAINWARAHDNLPRAFLAATWLRENGFPSAIDPTLIELAHYAFAEEDASPPSQLDELLRRSDLDLVGPDQLPGAWAVGAGLLLLKGWWQGLPLFSQFRWTESAPAVRRRTQEVLSNYWYRNTEAEPLPLLVRRLQVSRTGGEAQGAAARAAAFDALRRLLQRHPRFQLGRHLVHFVEQELGWMHVDLDPSVNTPSPRLAQWASSANPASDLDRWAQDVASDVRAQRVTGAVRAAMVRNLDDLRASIRDWVAVTGTSDPTAADGLDAQVEAVETLLEVVREEGPHWLEGWEDPPDGSGALGRQLVQRLQKLAQLPNHLEGSLF
jgi:hypothetical protein